MTKAKAPEKTEAVDLSTKFGKAYETATEKMKAAQAGAREFSAAATASGRAALEGIVEFDRAVLENLRSGMNESVAHGRAILNAPSLRSVVEMQQEFATKRLNTVTEQTKSLVDLMQAKVQASWAPLLDLAKAAPEKAADVKPAA